MIGHVSAFVVSSWARGVTVTWPLATERRSRSVHHRHGRSGGLGKHHVRISAGHQEGEELEHEPTPRSMKQRKCALGRNEEQDHDDILALEDCGGSRGRPVAGQPHVGSSASALERPPESTEGSIGSFVWPPFRLEKARENGGRGPHTWTWKGFSTTTSKAARTC